MEISTTTILDGIKKINRVPLRVDFAGGWLDVPKLSRKGAFIVNCTIQPLVSLEHWPYEMCGGLGGSAARSILEVRDGVASELKLGVGWQDPAVIYETGLCVWRSGKCPVLDMKHNPDWLRGKMLIVWQGKPHNTPSLVDKERKYDKIETAAFRARNAVKGEDIHELATAVNLSYRAQIDEGMNVLPTTGPLKKAIAKKYLGGGWGGYALYLFSDKKHRNEAVSKIPLAKKIEPYMK